MHEEPEPSFAFAAVARLDTRLWGVWDRRHCTWAEPPEHSRDAAERRAVSINEAYAAGFADAMIVKAHARARLRRFP